MAIEEQRMNRSSFDIIENRPESETSNPLPDGAANEQKRFFSFRLEKGETLLGRNTDISF